MLEKGYTATTIDAICRKAEVTKGSFFHYFKNKENLGKMLIERFSCSMGEAFQNSSCCQSDDPLDRVYGYLDCAIQMLKNPSSKGCLVGTFTQELSKSHPGIRALCAKSFDQSLEMFKKDFAEAKAKYVPKNNFDVAGLVECFMALSQGSIILAKAKRDRSVIERTLSHFRHYLKSLFER